MPELPDVETFLQYLKATALHKRVREVSVREARVLGNTSEPKLRRALSGEPLEEPWRHGKYLLVHAGEERLLVLHFGMTGELAYYKDPAEEPAHARVVLELANGYRLAFDCPRLLGRIFLVRDADAFLRARDIGPDALRMGEDAFVAAVRGGRGGVKSFLMNQSRLAGIGNVYADEICFQARRDPGASRTSLSEKEARELYAKEQHVLRTAIRKQAERDRFPRSWITPRRGRGEAECPRGCGRLATGKVNGRTTYWCPECQSGGSA